MEFRLLGPVEFWAGGRLQDLGPAKRRSVLAVLLMEAGRPVATDTLIDRIWPDNGAQSACSNVLYAHLTRIRQVLATAAAAEPQTAQPPRLERRSGGYALDTGDADVDVARFRQLLKDSASLANDQERRAALVGPALELWRGTPIADIPGDWACRVRQGLEQQRLTALVAWAQEQVRADAQTYASAVLRELSAVAAEHSLVEPVAAALMSALVWQGSPGQALAVYTEIRRGLAAEFGVDPSQELQELHRAILRGEERPSAAGAKVRSNLRTSIPAQLPPTDRGFQGRHNELSELGALLTEHQRERPDAPLIVVVTGAPGMGKTSVAVHWAHAVRHFFTDGQLFINLHGYSSSPVVQPLHALIGFLRALGVSTPQPITDLAEAVALYRTVTADRRMLVVLDNVAELATAQVLLPSNRDSLVIITSRDSLSELATSHGARRLKLKPFSPQESKELLVHALGKQRAGADQEQAAAMDQLARLCAHLPLALRIAAAHLDDRPYLRISEYVAKLSGGDRLSALGSDRDSVRATFGFSYEALDPAGARAFRLLGTVPGNDITVAGVGALLDRREPAAEALLDRLTRAQLIERDDVGRISFHDLLRAYAADRAAAEEPPAEIRLSGRALLRWYLAVTVAADRLLDPRRYREPLEATGHPQPLITFSSRQGAISWLDAERDNLLAEVQHAARSGEPTLAWKLAWALWGYFDFTKPWSHWVQTYQTGLACARITQDAKGQAAMMLGLGTAHYYPQKFGQALQCYAEALNLYRAIGDPRGEGLTLNGMGNVQMELGRYDSAIDTYRQALAIHREAGNLRDEGVVLNNLSEMYCRIEQYEAAAEHALLGLDLHRCVGNRRTEVFTLCHLANAYWRLGRQGEALDLCEQAISLSEELGDRHSRAWALSYLGQLVNDQGRQAQAHHYWLQAIELFDGIGDPHAADIRGLLRKQGERGRDGAGADDPTNKLGADG